MRTQKNWASIMTAEAAQEMKSLGQLIQIARKRRKMSVSDLANRVGADRRTISQLEKGSPGVSLGVFMQVLSVLNLVRGFSEVLQPENDIDAITIEVRRARKRGRAINKIDDEEVDF